MSNGNGKTERARILELHVRNVKRIREVAIDQVGDIREIRGDADQGKTSILDSIEGALRGLDPDMVRRGSGSAELELRLTTATIKRIVPADGSADTLLVTDRDGKPVDKAKDFLRTICSASTFRPIEWVRLGGGEAKGKTERLRLQRKQLIEALPVSLTAEDVLEAVKGLGPDYVEALGQANLDGVSFDQHAFVVCGALFKVAYDHRYVLNQRAEDREGYLKQVPAPTRPAPRADLATCQAIQREAEEAFHGAKARLQGQEELHRRREQLRTKVEAEDAELPDVAELDRTAAHYSTERDEALSEIGRLEEALLKARERHQDAKTKLERCASLRERIASQDARKKDLASIEVSLGQDVAGVDLEGLRKAMADAQADVESRRSQDAHDAAAKTAAEARRMSTLFDGLVELFRDAIPKALVAGANLPIEELSVDDDQILIGGIPLHQLGTSKQIRLGVIIAAALNPRSGFVLVDGAESLGRADRLELASVAKEMNLQLIMTYVDPDAVPSQNVTVMREGVAVSS